MANSYHTLSVVYPASVNSSALLSASLGMVVGGGDEGGPGVGVRVDCTRAVWSIDGKLSAVHIISIPTPITLPISLYIISILTPITFETSILVVYSDIDRDLITTHMSMYLALYSTGQRKLKRYSREVGTRLASGKYAYRE